MSDSSEKCKSLICVYKNYFSFKFLFFTFLLLNFSDSLKFKLRLNIALEGVIISPPFPPAKTFPSKNRDRFR